MLWPKKGCKHLHIGGGGVNNGYLFLENDEGHLIERVPFFSPGGFANVGSNAEDLPVGTYWVKMSIGMQSRDFAMQFLSTKEKV